MPKLLLALMILVALAGPAVAGFAITMEASVPAGDVHMIDASLHDNGDAVLLVDGEPLLTPALPSAPSLPQPPALPTLP